MKAIITVDVGTTSVRACLYAADARLLHMAQRANIPASFDDGRVEQDPLACRASVLAVLSACAQVARDKAMAPACIAITAQRSSVIPVDRHGRHLHPAIMWQDRRTAGLAREMDALNPLVYGKTGLRISPVFSALKMTWLRRNRPEVWRQTHKLLGIQDWIIHGLTGAFVTDQTFGSRTNLLNLQTRQWDAELLSLFEVEPGMLCDLVAPGSVVGTLGTAAASSIGLTAGLPVVSAGGDQQCAALGLGLFSGERAVSNTGTGSYLIGHADKPALDPAMGLACNVSAVPGAYIVEAAVLTSGTIYRWFNESVCRSADAGDAAFEAINAEAARVPPGANGLVLLPHFKGCGSPYWDPQAKGVFFNVSLSTSRGEMARAILEGIAIEMKTSLELVERLCGAVRSVSVSGGLTRSDLFNQIQSDIFERPVVRFASNEATSGGAWIAGAVATSVEASYPAAFARLTEKGASTVYQCNAATHAVYARKRAQSQALYQALAAPGFRAAIEKE
jgi:sugar (pentulose or hexulose) kinase